MRTHAARSLSLFPLCLLFLLLCLKPNARPRLLRFLLLVCVCWLCCLFSLFCCFHTFIVLLFRCKHVLVNFSQCQSGKHAKYSRKTRVCTLASANQTRTCVSPTNSTTNADTAHTTHAHRRSTITAKPNFANLCLLQRFV